MKPTTFFSVCAAIVCLNLIACRPAQDEEPNYDEARVPAYTLPDPLKLPDGTAVTDARTWHEVRRPQILRLFEEQVYGRVPESSVPVRFESVDREEGALDGRAVRKQVVLELAGSLRIDLLIYLPANRPAPHPVFLGLNFYGNHTIHSDPGIRLSASWMRDNENFGIKNNRASEASRGVRSNRWDVDQILERGYGLATIYYGDIDPDFDDGFQNGVHPLLYRPGQDRPADDEWGSISAWAWGLSRAMDYFERDDEIDAGRIAVMGHSRLGKT